MFNNNFVPYEIEELSIEQQKVILEELTNTFEIPESILSELKKNILISNIMKFMEDKISSILNPKKEKKTKK